MIDLATQMIGGESMASHTRISLVVNEMVVNLDHGHLVDTDAILQSD